MCTFELPLGTMEVSEINLAPYPMPALDAVSREHQIPYTLQKDDGGKTGIVRIMHGIPRSFLFKCHSRPCC